MSPIFYPLLTLAFVVLIGLFVWIERRMEDKRVKSRADWFEAQRRESEAWLDLAKSLQEEDIDMQPTYLWGLEDALQKRDITAANLAGQLGLHRSSVYAWMWRNRPSAENLRETARILRTTQKALLHG